MADNPAALPPAGYDGWCSLCVTFPPAKEAGYCRYFFPAGFRVGFPPNKAKCGNCYKFSKTPPAGYGQFVGRVGT